MNELIRHRRIVYDISESDKDCTKEEIIEKNSKVFYFITLIENDFKNSDYNKRTKKSDEYPEKTFELPLS